ncbi:uncharacterized protein LOC144133722 [Amblyomma americanum]
MPLTRSQSQAPDVPDDRSPPPADSADDAAAGAARPRRSEGLGSSQQPDAGVERLLDTVTQRMDAWEARLTAQAGEMEALRRELRRLVPAEPSTGQVPLGVLAAAIERLALQSLPGAPQNAVALVGTEAFVDAIRLPEVQRLVRSGSPDSHIAFSPPDRQRAAACGNLKVLKMGDKDFEFASYVVVPDDFIKEVIYQAYDGSTPDEFRQGCMHRNTRIIIADARRIG